MLALLAAAAAAAAPVTPPPEPAAVEAVEIVTRAPLVGTLQQGIQAYRPEYFTQVRPGSAYDMIQWLPGFTFEEMKDVRGLAGAAGNVLIDGQPPTSKNDTLQNVLRRIPAGQVERVDIIVGGAPGIDMRGRSVIANVVLRKGAAPLGAITASNQFYQDGRTAPELLVNLSKKSSDRLLEGSLNAYRKPANGTGPGTGVLERDDPNGAVLFRARSRIGGPVSYAAGSAGYQFPFAGGKLKLSTSANVQTIDVDERADLIGAPALYTIRLYDNYRQGEVGLRYERTFGRINLESQLLQRLNGHHHEADTDRAPVQTDLVQSDTLSETVARSTVRFNQSPRLTLEGSAEGALNRLDTNSNFRDHGAVVRLPAEDVTISERRGEFGLLATWKPSSTFSMTAAGKLEASHLQASGDIALGRTLTYLKPRLVIAWSPDAKTQLRLRGEHEVSQINFSNFSATVDDVSGQARAGNPDLKPKRAWVAEAALERQFWTGASLVLTLRQSALKDVVDWRPLPAFGNAVAVGNIGDGKETAVIATLTLPLKRLGLSGANLKGSMTWKDQRVTDPTTLRPRRLSNQSAVVGDLHFSQDLPRWKLTWGSDARYDGPSTNYLPTVIEHGDHFLRLSAFVEYRARPDLNLRVEAFNLNDAKPPFVIYPYAALRGSSPLLYSERRANGDGTYLFVRVRKTLG